jgi:molybdopterin-guanine dinucleotide biosynthesis protein A
MNAIVLAGGIPQPDDPLYVYTQGKPKSLLDIAGKSMLQWVLDALDGSEHVDNIVIVGLDDPVELDCSKTVTLIPNRGGMLANARAGLHHVTETDPEAELALVVSADIPAITAEMVDWTVKTAQESDHDLYYNLIERDVMEHRYPQSNRSFVHMKDAVVCGGDMNVIRCDAAVGNDEFWERAIAARKNVFKQAALIGYGTLFLMLIRQLSIEAAVQRGFKKLGFRCRTILCPYPEIGMDVDKPYHVDILRADLEGKKPHES